LLRLRPRLSSLRLRLRLSSLPELLLSSP